MMGIIISSSAYQAPPSAGNGRVGPSLGGRPTTLVWPGALGGTSARLAGSICFSKWTLLRALAARPGLPRDLAPQVSSSMPAETCGARRDDSGARERPRSAPERRAVRRQRAN
jgi:hypothetical protein